MYLYCALTSNIDCSLKFRNWLIPYLLCSGTYIYIYIYI